MDGKTALWNENIRNGKQHCKKRRVSKTLPWSIVTSKASLAHIGAIVNDQSLNFVTHLVSLKERGLGGYCVLMAGHWVHMYDKESPHVPSTLLLMVTTLWSRNFLEAKLYYISWLGLPGIKRQCVGIHPKSVCPNFVPSQTQTFAPPVPKRKLS